MKSLILKLYLRNIIYKLIFINDFFNYKSNNTLDIKLIPKTK